MRSGTAGPSLRTAPASRGRTPRGRRARWVAVLLGALLPGAAPAQSAGDGVVRGTVRTETGIPLGGVQLRVVPAAGGALRAESDEDGRVQLARVPAGPAWVQLRRLGYRPESLAVTITPGTPVEVAPRMVRTVVELTAVVVKGRSEVAGPMAGFFRRQQQGHGRFFTAAEVERRNPIQFTDLLRGVPGIRIEQRGMNTAVRIRGSRCAPLVWLDGQAMGAGEVDLDAFDPRTFEGIEIYGGGASVPAEFQRNFLMSSSCGTLLLWSKRGEPRARRRAKDALTPAAQIALWLERGEVFAARDVDRPAALDSAAVVRPVYPDSLFEARAPGALLAEFVVNAKGDVELDSYNVVTTTHTQLVVPVRNALRDQRFAPAERGGQRVRQVVQQPFTFVPDSTARRRK
jgi:hypothetical protein